MCRRPRGAPRGRLRGAGQKKIKIIYLIYFYFYFYFLLAAGNLAGLLRGRLR
jgi:hypothetical protein